MGRRPTIDREQVLAVAEELVAERGAAALTIDAVAKAAGITKGGVQSCFGTKEALIAAMFQRWLQDYAQRASALAGANPSPPTRVAAHAETTHRNEEAQRRVASLLALLLQSPEHLSDFRAWYQDQWAGLDADDAAARRARLAFLATEGAFFLRFLGLLPIGAGEWDAVFRDIRGLIEGRSLGGPAA